MNQDKHKDRTIEAKPAPGVKDLAKVLYRPRGDLILIQPSTVAPVPMADNQPGRGRHNA